MITKTRTTGTDVPREWTVFYDEIVINPSCPAGSRPAFVTGVDYGNHVVTHHWVNDGESISYSLRNVHNRCEHTRAKTTVFNGSIAGEMMHWTQPSWWQAKYRIGNVAAFCEIGRYGIAGSGFSSTLANFLAQHPVDWETAYAARALSDMWPGVQEAVSLPNFLLELGDVTTLWRSLRKAVIYVRNLLGDSVARRTLRQVVSATAAEAGDLRLAYQFGLLPFVDDLLNLKKAIGLANQNARRLRKNISKRLISHWRLPLPCAADSFGWRQTSYANTPMLYEYRVGKYTCMYTATLEYSYELDAYQRRNLESLVLLDSLGLHFNPKHIWDAVPFSFVLDYVVKIGDFLDQCKVPNVRPIVKVHGFCQSVKTVRVVERRAQAYIYGSLTGPDFLVASETKTSYSRRPKTPSFYQALMLSGISGSEALNLTALGVTRRGKPRKRR